MSGTPLPPPAQPPPGGGGPEGAAALPTPPGTDMTGICFRDQLWLNNYPLDRNLVFDYFALSPFYVLTCNNESFRSRQIYPLDMSHLTKMTGMEYVLSDVMEPHLFVIRKQRRKSPEKANAMLAYYILDGSIYQAPQSAASSCLASVGLCTTYQKLLIRPVQSWRKLGMWKQSLTRQLLNQRCRRKRLT